MLRWRSWIVKGRNTRKLLIACLMSRSLGWPGLLGVQSRLSPLIFCNRQDEAVVHRFWASRTTRQMRVDSQRFSLRGRGSIQHPVVPLSRSRDKVKQNLTPNEWTLTNNRCKALCGTMTSKIIRDHWSKLSWMCMSCIIVLNRKNDMPEPQVLNKKNPDVKLIRLKEVLRFQ